MSTVTTLPLTQDQIEQLKSKEHPWMAMTPEQEELIRSAGPDEACTFYGDVIIRMPQATLEAAHEFAFKAAAKAALELIGATADTEVEVSLEKPELGQTYLRVTATDDTGKSATAIGMIPDPRGH